ncbi:Mitomycin radical oxidase [Streptomyces davaonensis JCM 4913]|uniref:Mitomycin radical oxidase n=1 Tax=Streptomyces davaonensis (strain DSM 101723 / JCM 4913 / KCC S-0913 / 768) TaxID=1214101 RepID=K4RB58_STRDJ|nr:FAD-binding oxidoreductase [Streptomyces davaonensis]CCK30039.1 Mitomycin radical oxidase [Streptomyces davaonensis JCM 4913]
MTTTHHHVPVLHPGESGYDRELAGFQTGFTQRPELIVPARSADDVIAAVRLAPDRNLPVAVQSTGHGLPGSAEGGLLITTRRMDRVTVDPEARTARVQAGVRWGQVVEAAAPHGLAPLNGSAPSVGAVGYLLGGGLGILAREFGYAADHVRSVDLVTADGRLRHVTPGSDLYWALLGGGGHGFGVVTELEIGLVPVRSLFGGSLVLDGGEVEPAAVLRAYAEWTRTVPDGLTSTFAAVPYPDVPAMPPHLRGRYILSVRVAWTGADGDQLVEPLRKIGPVLSDSLREMPYAESHTIHNDPDFPHAYYGDSAVLSELDVEKAAQVLARTGPGTDAMVVVQINQLGGALAAPAPNSVPNRDGAFLVRLLAMADREQAREILDPAFALLAPRTLGRSPNFAFGTGDRSEGLHDEETRKRLAGVKDQHDPANRFRRTTS